MASIKELIAKVLNWITSIGRPSMYSYTEADLRKRIIQLQDFYRGNQIKWTLEELNKVFYSPQSLKMQPSMVNITRYLSDFVPNVFKNGISVRTMTENETEQEIYDKILEDARMDVYLQTLSKYTWLLHTMLTKVSWRDGKIALDMITPEFVVLEQDAENPLKLSSITYPKMVTNVDRVNFTPQGSFHYWSDTEYYIVDEKGNRIYIEGNEDNVNPYGIIPIVFSRTDIPTNTDMMIFPGEELINAQLTVNINKTELQQLIRLQSFSIPVLKNGPTDIIRGSVNINIDPSVVLALNDRDENKKASFEFVSPSAKIVEVQEALDSEIIRIFSTFGVNPGDFVKTADRASAESIVEGNAKLQEGRDNLKQQFTYFLQDLFKVIRIVWNTHNPDQQLSEDGVEVIIHESRLNYKTIQDKWLDYESKLKYNLITPADILLDESTDLTYDEAYDKILANKEENDELKKGESPAETTTSDSQSPDMDEEESMRMEAEQNATEDVAQEPPANEEME